MDVTEIGAPATYGPTCPLSVERRAMVMRWDRLTFLHWRYDPAVVQALLPPGLEVDTFDGSAWVGLVPFLMEVRLPFGPAVPWLSHFCETNVRTYVRAPDGTTGVWFLSLDAARFLAVATARTTYRLPYLWSAMSLEETGGSVGNVATYRNRRRWPGPKGAASTVSVRVGEQYAPEELGDLDHFLTARWRLYSHRARGLRWAPAQHDPWALHRAEVLDLHDELVTVTGLPAPVGEPLVHWSPGVEVTVGFPATLPPAPTADSSKNENAF